jgi:hypothetical protein
MPKKDLQPAHAPQPPLPLTNNFVNNNWVTKTDFKGLKSVKGVEEDIMKKESKPIIIMNLNLNMTIIQTH